MVMKNKRRIICLYLFCILCCLLGTGCSLFSSQASPPDYTNMKKSQLQTSVAIIPHSLEDLERYSQYIVEGVLQNDAETCVSVDSQLEGAVPYAGATKSSLVITRVLKDNGELQAGDSIPIYEPFYVYDVQDEPCLFYMTSYLPSEAGKTYLFFLNKNALDGYAPSGMENSRFPVPSTQTRASVDIDSLTKEDLSLAESADLEKYKALYKEVLEEYGE